MRKVLAAPTQHVTATCARYWQLPLDMSPLHAQGTSSSHSTCHRYMRKVLAAPTRRHRYMRKVLAAPTQHVTATCARYWQLPLNMSPLHAQGTGSSHSTCHRYMRKVLAAPTRRHRYMRKVLAAPTRHVTATCARYWQLPLDMSPLHAQGTGSSHSTCHCYYVHGTGPGTAMCTCHSTCHRYMCKILAAPTRHVTATCARKIK
ncbi:hypothetical protein ROHU_005188 [Labeo rohita]|uniref:Uncharacterized protein n=1 Tax=Labeo rohita TaxID=84645 RepID=A0A498NDZ9_LABRO|nr:hypothetical protein ROHU_005188 [Labeo rohita]